MKHDPEQEARWDAEYEASVAETERRLMMTDDEVKGLGLKEYQPGYYWGDPRYPTLGPVERWLLDHAAPPKNLSKLPRKAPRDRDRDKPIWDEGQFSGATLDEPAPSMEFRRIYPVSKEAKKPVTKVAVTYQVPEGSRTTYGLWLCQVCRQQQALWPHEIGWQRKLLGLRLTLIVRAPYACTNCRIMHFGAQRLIGHQDHRPFWSNVIALITGESMTETITPIRWINRQRYRYFGRR